MQLDDRLAKGEDENEVIENEIKKDIKYKKIDSEAGFLTDEVEIENFKIYQKRDIFCNLMLGDYNESGDYFLNVDLLKGLVRIKKVLTGNYNKTFFYESINSFGQKGNLKFSLTINDSKDEPGVKIAVLKLLESVKKIGGYIENTNTFVVASYKDKYSEEFVKKVNKVFNIVENTDADIGQDDPEVVNAIMQRLKGLEAYGNAYIEDIADLEKEYYYARLEILKNPEFEGVLAEFKKHLTKGSMFINPNSPLYYAFLNELIDLSIGVISSRNPELGQKINEAQRQIMQKHNEIILLNEKTVIEKMQNTEQSISSSAVLTKGTSVKSKGAAKANSKSQNKSSGGRSSSGGKSDGKSSSSKKTDFKIPKVTVKLDQTLDVESPIKQVDIDYGAEEYENKKAYEQRRYIIEQHKTNMHQESQDSDLGMNI